MNLSFVIPVYRNESTVARALQSVDDSWSAIGCPGGLNVVVVLDGVVDGSLDIVNAWSKATRLPHQIVVQSNAGIAAARNVAWRAATTEWITFLDADDETTIVRLVYARDRALPDTVSIGQQELVVSSGLRVPGTRSSSTSDRDAPTFHITSMLIERTVLDSLGGFDESLRLSDDWDLAIRLKENDVPIHFVEEPFVRRFIHGQNASFDESTTSKEYLQAIRAHLQRSKS